MLFLVQMDVRIPPDTDPEEADRLRAEERRYAQELQRSGKWRHLWRVAGKYANVSVFDVDTHDELHEIVSGLPLFPYLHVEVTPLAAHPSALPAS